MDAHVIAWIEHRAGLFARVLIDGGSIVTHPDTWAELRTGAVSPWLTAILRAVGREVDVTTNRYITPGDLYAIPKPPPIRFGFVDFDMAEILSWRTTIPTDANTDQSTQETKE